jgi:hypothetical protein
VGPAFPPVAVALFIAPRLAEGKLAEGKKDFIRVFPLGEPRGYVSGRSERHISWHKIDLGASRAADF